MNGVLKINKQVPAIVTGIFIIMIMISSVPAETEKSGYRPEVPEGWIVLKEGYLDPLDGEAQHHFIQAKEDFLAKRLKNAATEVRKSAVFLRIEAAGSTQKGGEALKEAYDELESLAGRIEKGSVRSETELDDAFFRAHHALAENFYYLASAYLGRNNVEKTGKHIQILTDSIERAIAWSGHKVEEETYSAINEARILAGRMKEGAGWTVEDVVRVLERLEKEIKKLGKNKGSGK